MTSKWETKPLGELLELVIDHRGKTPKKMGFDDFHSDGHPVLSAKHVKTDELVNLEAMRFANEEMYKKWMKVEVREGDIALTSEAPMGEVFYLDGKEKYVLGQRVFGLRPNRELIDPLYLTAWLTSRRGQEQLSARASGSTVLGIKQSELLKIDVDMPPYGVQLEIAKARYDLTRKIGINRQINQTLGQIAQAIFKSWFIDFEPVKAKIQAKQNDQDPERAAMRAISGKTDEQLGYLSLEQNQQLTTTAALFPDELEESQLGEIPKGWPERRVDDLLELAYGKALKKTDRRTGIVPVYGSGGVTGFHNNHLVEGPGIIVGRKGTVGSLHWEDSDFFPIDTVFYVLPKEGFSLEYIYYLLQTLGLENMNTDAAVPGLNRNNVYRLAVAGHPVELVEMYSIVVNSFTNKETNNKKESTSLTDIRNFLLPKLLTGELEVQEVA